MGDVKIKGTFLGEPIDIIICESESVPDSEAPPAPAETPAETPSAEAPSVENVSPSDPPPESKPVSDEAKNPAGNSEQL